MAKRKPTKASEPKQPKASSSQAPYAKRRDRLRAKLRSSGHSAILVTNVTNVTYLSGFTGDSSYLLLTRKNELILTDTRYQEQIEGECPGLEMAVRDSTKSMNQLLSGTRWQSQTEPARR